jgi:uncharacterized OB-fold protein
VTAAYRKPLPAPDAFTKPFWDGCKAGELRMLRCARCGTYVFFPAPACHACGSMEVAWVPVSGKGSVYSFIVVRQANLPAFAAELPYVVAWVELAEQPGLKMVSNIVGCDPKDVRVGMPVQVTFEQATDEVTLPKFRPTA